MNYYTWLVDDEDDSFAWFLDTPKELMETDYLLRKGNPCKEWFTEGMVFDLSEERGSALTDAIPNTDRLLVVSEKLKDLLERHAPEDSIEFLPVRLRTPEGRLIPQAYFVANVLGTVACVNREESKFTMNAILKDQVGRFQHLVLDEPAIPDGKKIFRLAELRTLIIARQDLAQAIVDADCTGMLFIPLKDYGAEFRSDVTDDDEDD
ncbi:imm11 family protein [Ramlibacter humi]|uniref:Immunity MXAN-0049 protein domain-containing protein n=1 Tax=Ramlibacter humi TaxID=2530451 RepID=A0A4Z0BT34_9BURK|nr:DUF1629 domain-containing protein [Ramlibacter humi]TFZ02001.1 hypothetical protein EZ216_12550 [Ramlibacter humi]